MGGQPRPAELDKPWIKEMSCIDCGACLELLNAGATDCPMEAVKDVGPEIMVFNPNKCSQNEVVDPETGEIIQPAWVCDMRDNCPVVAACPHGVVLGPGAGGGPPQGPPATGLSVTDHCLECEDRPCRALCIHGAATLRQLYSRLVVDTDACQGLGSCPNNEGRQPDQWYCALASDINQICPANACGSPNDP